ncbi:uncharacterized protein LOC126378389 isoform X2 [Pectinophora gossypiella]|uniref:uncharacterized protein LOC126378389 isoform X2 n=1 Tax=Pectinophora gossypiella TaxID=13191 RepID=UPI00214EA440|nr:uncharacterized protein LOC126378389 isoform X2 [Pectinophora gossypiella]
MHRAITEVHADEDASHMAYANGSKKHWDEEDTSYSSASHSDDSPILSYRHDKRRFASYTPVLPTQPEDRERRSTLSVVGKFCLFSVAMIMFCVLMYVPVYNKANYHLPKGIVAGWSAHTNRDTKIYVQPNNVTIIHEPKHVCETNKQNKLFLLIIVSSSTGHFRRRKAIRETWADYNNYKKYQKIFNEVRDKYKKYDFSYDLFPRDDEKHLGEKYLGKDFYLPLNNTKIPRKRIKKDISSFKQLIPVLAEAINHINLTKTDDVPEKRFDDDDDMLQGFDMNKEIGTQTESTESFDYEYDTNIMKIPPAGYEDLEEPKDLNKIIALLKKSKDIRKVEENVADDGNTERDFRVVFLLGLPVNKTLQSMIEEEVDTYGDIIQEGFIDSYNNLTLKSIMMLKWITNKCNDRVRYILKTDDDMYINVMNLLLTLRNRSAQYDKKVAEGFKSKEYMLIGDLISGARPVSDLHSKWYTPRYMYDGRVYPHYLSGTAYAFSSPAAHALYQAALATHYFHLEDIYITGMCSLRTRPRVIPRDEPLFSYQSESSEESNVCCGHARITVHRVRPAVIRVLQGRLLVPADVDRCERIRLTKIREQRSIFYGFKKYFRLLPINICCLE